MNLKITKLKMVSYPDGSKTDQIYWSIHDGVYPDDSIITLSDFQLKEILKSIALQDHKLISEANTELKEFGQYSRDSLNPDDEGILRINLSIPKKYDELVDKHLNVRLPHIISNLFLDWLRRCEKNKTGNQEKNS